MSYKPTIAVLTKRICGYPKWTMVTVVDSVSTVSGYLNDVVFPNGSREFIPAKRTKVIESVKDLQALKFATNIVNFAIFMGVVTGVYYLCEFIF